MSVYTENGYQGRENYLTCLAEEHGVDVDYVFTLAELLGHDEDFDGLVTSIEEIGEGYGY